MKTNIQKYIIYILIVIASILFFYLLGYIEAFEMIVEWTRKYEKYKLDELILIFPVFAFALSILCFYLLKEEKRMSQKLLDEKAQRDRAEQEVEETLKLLRNALRVNIQVIVAIIETRDPFTAGHQSRVTDLARAITTEMGLPMDQINGIRSAGIVHDIGNISVPSEILNKAGRISEVEFALIKEHPRIGYNLLKEIESPLPIAEIVYQHHERMDGSGYPQGLRGEEIMMEARILAVADVVEAMSSHRAYRPALGIDAALEEISMNKGKLYDPNVVDTCLKLINEKGYKFPVK